MKRITLILLFLINLLYAENRKFYSPSFNCDNVKKDSVEYLICTDKNLSQLDKELSEIYKKTLEKILEKEELKNEQREFLKDRKTCKKEERTKSYCVKKLYEDRIYILNAIYKFITVNLEDYKLQKIEELDIKDFIYIRETTSKLYAKKLLSIIDIFEESSYILVENGFLIKFYDVRISNGIYYININTGKVERVAGGLIHDWFIVDDFKPTKIVFESGDGYHGVADESIESITLKDDGSIEKKVILEVFDDMEGGLCHNSEILGITKAGDIKSYEYDKKNNLLKIYHLEQICPDGEILNKELIYDLKK